MSDYLSFLPVFNETIARVRARMDADANANLTTSDPGYLDTREGTFYYDVTQTAALEIVRLWDALGSETVAVAFPSVAWGDYLDEHALTFGLSRNAAQFATVLVAVYMPVGGIVGQGTIFAAAPSDPSQAVTEFVSTASATALPYSAPPDPVTVVAAQTGGTLPADTYYYHVTSVSQYGESNGSVDESDTVTTATGQCTISWPMVDEVTSFNIYRSDTPATMGQLLVSVPATTLSFVDTGALALQDTTEPPQNGTIVAQCPCVAVVAGTAGNLSATAITQIETVVTGATFVTNIAPSTGGQDPEDDEDLRTRILAQYIGQGSGTIASYTQICLAQAGIERVTVIPTYPGPGDVLVIIYQDDGTPVTSDVVASLQKTLDPVTAPGQGAGQAPIGATVTVVTTVPLSVDIVATVAQQTGYSLLGSGGTVSTQPAILNALTAYLDSLDPGDTLIYQQVEAAFFVEGVREVATLTINGVETDIDLSVSPAQSAVLGTTTFS